MRRSKKLFLVALACAGMTMALLVTIVLVTHLMANRTVVRAYINAKAAQITGGTLDYDRLTIGYLPMPHVKVRGIHLHHPDHFSIHAKELSVYVQILPLISGKIHIRQLALHSPDMKIHRQPDGRSAKISSPSMDFSSLWRLFSMGIQSVFGAMANIDPGLDVRIDQGKLTLMAQQRGKFELNAINATLKNDGNHLRLAIEGRSDFMDEISIGADADTTSLSATGNILLTGLDLFALTENGAIFGNLGDDLGTASGRATVKTEFTVHGPNALDGRLDVRLPNLSVKRKKQSLELQSVVVAGGYELTDRGLSVTLDTIQSNKPALDLSANTIIGPTKDKDGTTMVFRAAANRLDVAVAGDVARDLFGDLDSIQTAFTVAREGILTDVNYFAEFTSQDDGWKKTTMGASGHLTDGRITILGIEADIERMTGDVDYKDKQVTFSHVNGRFKGADFAGLDGSIHWEGPSRLFLASPDVDVDMETLFYWLTSFKAIAGLKQHIASITGFSQLSTFRISGPLTKPGGLVS